MLHILAFFIAGRRVHTHLNSPEMADRGPTMHNRTRSIAPGQAGDTGYVIYKLQAREYHRGYHISSLCIVNIILTYMWVVIDAIYEEDTPSPRWLAGLAAGGALILLIIVGWTMWYTRWSIQNFVHSELAEIVNRQSKINLELSREMDARVV